MLPLDRTPAYHRLKAEQENMFLPSMTDSSVQAVPWEIGASPVDPLSFPSTAVSCSLTASSR